MNKSCRLLLWILCYSFILSFLIYRTVSDTPDFLKPKTIRLYQFRGNCRGYEHLPMYLKDIRIFFANRTYYVSFKRIVKKNITDNMKLELTLNRCRGRESSDACEKYQTIHVNHLCNIMMAENKPWSPLMKSASGTMSCPLSAGVVEISNGTFDGSAFAHIPVSGWVWKITPKIFNERTQELLMCMFVEAQIAPI